jgi:serine protease AprX
MKKHLLFSVILFGFTSNLNAQTQEQRAKLTPSINKTELKKLENSFSNEHFAAEKKVQAYLKTHPLLKRSFVKNGSFYYLQRIDADGNPVYINTKSNVESGTLIKANQLYSGGSLGVNITGQNMVAGIWDGGQVRATHELLAGKVAMQAGQTLDGSAANHKGNNHQTHVSGTIVGKELASQPSARGIAYGATAQNYDWDNDKVEMASFASSGFLISNHSYGYANDNTTPVWTFGAYDSEARAWDVIAKNAPNYLPFVAAGNEQQPSDNGNNSKNGYDLITGASAAKNVMTVGALNADKAMSSYSNWGPTDDGRVKPEIVARGTDIYSAQFATATGIPSDNAYVESNGTSYATPAAAAAGLLLQQYYNSLYGIYMKAATLKALMLGTAEDLGQPGPDPKFGWGLLDVEKAAKAIKTKSASVSPNNQQWSDGSSRGSYIEEITYNLPPYIDTDPNRQELFRNVTARGNGEPLIVSIAWTDTEGTEQTSTNGTDPTTSRLVHNFDILVRVRNPIVDTRPWKPVTMANRTADATTQTNWFDGNANNYKQVKILNPIAGAEYSIYFRKSATSPNTLVPLSLVVTGTALAGPTATTQTRCQGQTVADLVVTSGSSIKWYSVATGGTALATTTALATGTYYATQTVDGVESLRTSVVVTVNNCTSTITSVATGNWETPATWDLNRLPTSADNVIINNNHTVTVTGNDANAKKVETRANGKVIFNDNNTKIKLGF